MTNLTDTVTAATLERTPETLEIRVQQDAAFWALRDVSVAFPEKAAAPLTCHQIPPQLSIRRAGEASLLWARLGSEWFALRRHGVPVALAGLVAARVATLFALAEGLSLDGSEHWLAPLQKTVPPAAPDLNSLWQALRQCWTGPSADLEDEQVRRLIALWPIIATTEAIMETGGDIRLLRDPQSNLNGYGCSHRPRPWAITYASSTASSVSERGYEFADRIRVRATARMLAAGNQDYLQIQADGVRRAIRRYLHLPAGAEIVLAASGTDCELLSLALSHRESTAPLTTILLAPEETGSGVPMAAVGQHFAVDTANGHDVIKTAPVEGYRPDTVLAPIPLRDQAGGVRPDDDVETDITAAVEAALGQGRRVILHALDLSKTGLLAPRMPFLRTISATYAGRVQIVVDACQTRVSPARIGEYVALGAIVQVTGSKFLTGPPFAGAIVLPPHSAARLTEGSLPSGLIAYSSRGDWPRGAAVARHLPAGTNYGLVLRWCAALAELHAFLLVPDDRKSHAIGRFGATVEQAIHRHRIFTLQACPALAREPEGWDAARTIFAFAVRAAPGSEEYLGPDDMRKLYFWLNCDCSAAFETSQDRCLAARICHIGQPVSLPNETGGRTGWLRVSAGARLLSGEPSHRDLGFEQRLDREMDDLGLIFDKISLLRSRWDRLLSFDFRPSYR